MESFRSKLAVIWNFIQISAQTVENWKGMTENWKGLAEIWKHRDELTRKLLILPVFRRHLECVSKRAEPMQHWHCFTGQLEGSSWSLEVGLRQFEKRLTLQLPPTATKLPMPPLDPPACVFGLCLCFVGAKFGPKEPCWASLVLLSA